ncbi:hypothetical protein EK21DRAFT_33734, partial [Setomelanomma holmii]
MFTRKFIAEGGPVDLALRELQSRDYSRLGENQANDCQTAHLKAVLSFSTIVFGAKTNQSAIIQQGYQGHGATLQQLNRALRQPDCYEYDEIIVSITTLAMQEMLVPSGTKLFLNHMMGLEKLLALRDPRSPCSPRTLSLYRCLRHLLLFAALTASRASVLAKPEWKAMFVQHSEIEQDLQEQQLYNILADCSELVVERDDLLKELNNGSNDQIQQVDNVRQRTDTILDELRTWRNCWNANPDNAFTEVPVYISPLQPSASSQSVAMPGAPYDLVFTTIFSALLLML